jgi:putative oxidoreductase
VGFENVGDSDAALIHRIEERIGELSYSRRHTKQRSPLPVCVMSISALLPSPTFVRSRPATIALWILQILLAGAFLGAGGAKLAGAAKMVAMYEAIGVGQWFRYVTGVFEIGGAIALLRPRLSALAAVWLMCIMVGAIITHLIILHSSPIVPLVLLIGLAIVAYVRRRELAAKVTALRG